MKDYYDKIDFKPIIFVLVALLSGARNDKNIHLSQKVHNHMKKLFTALSDSLTAASVLLANVYASTGEFEKASQIKTQLNEFGAKKAIGLT